MSYFLVVELLQIVACFIIMATSLTFCSCNDQNREQIHLQRRQALRNRQREAVISGRSVRSVIETEVEPPESKCPPFQCVRMTPRLKKSENADVYQRLNQNDETAVKIEKEKPPSIHIFENLTTKKSVSCWGDGSSDEDNSVSETQGLSNDTEPVNKPSTDIKRMV